MHRIPTNLKGLTAFVPFLLLAFYPSCEGAQNSNEDSSWDFRPVPTTHRFQFVGANLVTQERLEQIPGRQFFDFNGKPIDAIKFLASNGLNAVRVLATYGNSLTSSPVDNTNVDHRELNFQLDFGGIDKQVDIARRAKAAGQKIILTIQFGQEKSVEGNIHEFIPDAWLDYTYTQTLNEIDRNTRALLDPFLKAGIQPDIITCENEADSGMLFQYIDSSGKAKNRSAKEGDPFSNLATGNESIWPKCTGYWKQEILSAKEEITKRGFDNARTRFALHTTTNNDRAHYKFYEVFDNKHSDAERDYYDGDKDLGPMTVIPKNIRDINLRDLVDIIGFSYYPDPPTEGTQANFDLALAGKIGGGMDFTDDMSYFNKIIPKYGRYAEGPFKGQYKKQALIVEYATGAGSVPGFTVDCQNAFTTYFFNQLAQYEWALGAMWWEPTYAHNNWGGGHNSLFRAGPWSDELKDIPQFKPISTLTIWGSFAAH